MRRDDDWGRTRLTFGVVRGHNYHLRNKGKRTEKERDKCSKDGRRPGRTKSARQAHFPGPDAICSVDNPHGARPRVPGKNTSVLRAFSAGQNGQDALITLALIPIVIPLVVETSTSFGRVDGQKVTIFVFAPTDILRVNYLIDHLAADRHSHIHLVLLNMGFKNM